MYAPLDGNKCSVMFSKFAEHAVEKGNSGRNTFRNRNTNVIIRRVIQIQGNDVFAAELPVKNN